jgi:hypothetical protein
VFAGAGVSNYIRIYLTSGIVESRGNINAHVFIGLAKNADEARGQFIQDVQRRFPGSAIRGKVIAGFIEDDCVLTAAAALKEAAMKNATLIEAP